MANCPNCGYDLKNLTEREVQIESMLVKGMCAKEIAQVLEIAPKTVDVHRTAIYRKRGVHSQIGLMRLFYLGPNFPENHLPPERENTGRPNPPNHPWKTYPQVVRSS